MEIHCPHCGIRPITEYLYGELTSVPASIVDEDARDVDRGYMRNNPQGVQTERWFHVYGCRRWITLDRDTRTDQIVSSSGIINR